MDHVKAVLVSVVLAASLPHGGVTLEAQARQASGPPAPPITDFPPADRYVWDQLQRGNSAKAALRRLPLESESEQLTDLLRIGRTEDALRVLRVIVTTLPEQMSQAFEVVARNRTAFRSDARGYPDALQALVDEARKQLPRLPPEEAARVARQLLLIDRSSVGARLSFAEQLRRVVQTFAGTETALLTEVDAMRFGRSTGELLQALDEFIRVHPGTVVGAKALYMKGFALSSTVATTGLVPRGGDPTDRLMQVFEVVSELESGRYPRCEWVERAPTLVSGFFAVDPTYAPGNIDRQLDAYRAFVATHFVPDDLNPLGLGVGYIITSRMADLFERKGERMRGVEQVLFEIERNKGASARVRYLLAQFYIGGLRVSPVTERATWFQKATDTLRALSEQRGDPYQRKALATLASLYFSEQDYESARRYLAAFLNRYPRSEWAWVAALRLGRSQEALGDGEAAVGSYLSAAEQYGTTPFSRVLGYAFAAQAYDARGRFDLALRAYERALAGWDLDYGFGPAYTLEVVGGNNWIPPFVAPNEGQVAKRDLHARAARLRRSLAIPGGAILERGRWQFSKERWDDAVASLNQVIGRYPGSEAALEARNLKHQAALAVALTRADVGPSSIAGRMALNRIEAILQEGPYDFGVFAAEAAKAALLWNQGETAAARALLIESGRHWQSAHGTPTSSAPLTDLHQDLAAIRAVVLRPATEGTRREAPWTAPASESLQLPFALIDPELIVTLANGDVMPISIDQPIDGVGNVFFVTREQASFMGRVIAPLGAPRERAPDVREIGAFWYKFFPGGSVFSTAPAITRLEFLNPERSRAEVQIMFQSQYWTVLFEKVQGVWTVTIPVGSWAGGIA